MMAPRKVEKVVGYVRVSRVGGREAATFQSPEVHEQRIRAYAEAQGWEVASVLR